MHCMTITLVATYQTRPSNNNQDTNTTNNGITTKTKPTTGQDQRSGNNQSNTITNFKTHPSAVAVDSNKPTQGKNSPTTRTPGLQRTASASKLPSPAGNQPHHCNNATNKRTTPSGDDLKNNRKGASQGNSQVFPTTGTVQRTHNQNNSKTTSTTRR
jgi:hypothetical protein